MGKLTDTEIRTAKPNPEKEFYLNDSNGLYVRIYKSGRKVFAYRYKVGSSQKWMELGEYGPAKEGKLSLAEARSKAESARIQRREGIDPLEYKQTKIREQKAKIAQEKAEITVKELSDVFYKRQIEPRFKRPREWVRIMNSYILPELGEMRVKDIHRHHISGLLDKMIDRNARVMANRTLPVIKNMFAYAVEKGNIENSPAAMLTRKSVGGKEKSRDRALSMDEIKEFLSVINDESKCGASWQVVNCLKWLLLTGQRVGETLLVKWTDIDLSRNIWVIPESNTKNGKQNLVQITPQLMIVINHVKKFSGDSEYLFPSERNRNSYITTRAVSEALLRLFEKKLFIMAPFTPHDLRRTLVTGLGDLGVQPHVIEKIVNHTQQGVIGVYQRSEYLPERKAALELWGSELEKLIGKI